MLDELDARADKRTHWELIVNGNESRRPVSGRRHGQHVDGPAAERLRRVLVSDPAAGDAEHVGPVAVYGRHDRNTANAAVAALNAFAADCRAAAAAADDDTAFALANLAARAIADARAIAIAASRSAAR